MKYNMRSIISTVLCIVMVMSLTVSVYADPFESAELQSVKFDKSTYTLKIGAGVNTSLILTPEDAEMPEDLMYISSDPDIVKIDENGVIKAVATGSATITVVVISSQINASAKVSVIAPNLKYKISNVPDSAEKLISGFTVGITVGNAKASLAEQFASDNVIIQKTNGTLAADTDILSTGMNISTDSENYTVVIKGDVNGDGKITMDDTRTLVNYISGASSYPGAAFIEASSMTNSYVATRKLPDIESSLLISRHVLGKHKITQ